MGYTEATVSVDNATSKAHTVLQARSQPTRPSLRCASPPFYCLFYASALPEAARRCARRHHPFGTQVRTRDRKGLMYDSMRAAKDLKVNLSYGKARARARRRASRARVGALMRILSVRRWCTGGE